MAEEAKIPEALAQRQQLVELSDGSKILLEEWSWPKLLQLYQLIGDATKMPMLVEQSLREEDRPKLSAIRAVDLGKLASKIVAMNLPAVKNLIALGLKVGKVTEGEEPTTP